MHKKIFHYMDIVFPSVNLYTLELFPTLDYDECAAVNINV